MAFGVATDNNGVSVKNCRLKLPRDFANTAGSYRHETDDFVTPTAGLYFIFMCFGVSAEAAATVQQRGCYPPVTYVWQPINKNDIQLGCRAGILRCPQRGLPVSLSVKGWQLVQHTKSVLFNYL